MRRREFIILGGVALAWPLAAQAERIRRIAVLSPYPADDPEVMERIAAFRQGMQEHGWSEGRNLQIDYRWAGVDTVRLRSYATEMAGEPPDVIVAIASPTVTALRQATNTIPIVFVGIGDPVDQGFVASLARPGGNVTGFTGFEFSIGEKWLGFLKGLAPGVTRVALLFHPELGPFHSHWQNSVEAAAATLGVETTAAPVRVDADVARAISVIAYPERRNDRGTGRLHSRQSQADHQARHATPAARDLCLSPRGLRGWAHFLRSRYARPVSSVRILCRSHSQGR
jgi:putative tryptophan/tyrosine transport system substrate-binding protein